MRTGIALLTTGAFAAVAVPAASAATPFEDYVRINEVESNGSANDYIELYNNGPSSITFTNAAVADNDNSHVVTISGTIASGGFFTVDTDNASTPGNFGLGNADSARLYAEGQTPSTASPIDSYSWTAHASTSYGRYPDGTGSFVTLTATSKNAANAFTSPGSNPNPAPWAGVVINEVESNDPVSGAYDWVELYNTNTSARNISGLIIADDNNGHQVTVPSGTTLPAAGRAVVEVDNPANTGFYGLGGNDEVRLFAPGSVDVSTATAIDRVKWSTHAPTTYGLDRSSATVKGIFRTTSAATKGTTNTFGAPLPVLTNAEVVINEVESDPQGTPAFAGDWIELANKTGSALLIEGLALSDSDNTHTVTVEAGTVIPANGYKAIRVDDVAGINGAFGLGGADSARLFNAGANIATDTPIDSTSWLSHATNTWGRYPTNKTGAFANTAGPTPDAAN
ncbi:lamin tail domain-containing protein [Solirubrobacter phytolaccae]|uniref:Lamin tail domain-containing protein n=1 Tax=Solirubrobacter phytolaccae TaxID=1404360 RepID=A0A9X3S6W8_9ACTN|nr:lamin tail domain-containing protein [Solirubrobacter phytolaccae]MDA0180379.1 lamin tail domain-containing protein [Solirubrobacter phytolaccae]